MIKICKYYHYFRVLKQKKEVRWVEKRGETNAWKFYHYQRKGGAVEKKRRMFALGYNSMNPNLSTIIAKA